MATWDYKVLAGNVLTNGTLTTAPERKMAGVLLYLALEGPTSRQKLAGLLWSEVDEAKARNSLAQTLRRLRQATHPDIVTGDAVLQLDGDLQVDASLFKLLVFRGETAKALSIAGELLPYFEFDDCPEYSEWLLCEREEFRNLTAQALGERIAALEKQGSYGEALKLADRLVALDPIAEAPYRFAMRLHYLAGDRAAALKAYTACRTVLARELGVEPVAETQALAKLIEQGRLDVVPQERTDELPLEVRHPPILVGRSREWALMEEGWSKGQVIVIHGPPGVGKTRLMMEFAASKGRYLVTEGRPGDASAPYTSLARVFRRFSKAHPDAPVEPWVRQELSRFLPELTQVPPPPITSPQEQLRFEEALFLMLQRIVNTYDVIIVDDLQFYDPSSEETASRITNRMPAEGLKACTIVAFRTDEISKDYLRKVQTLAERNLLTLIEISPLASEATADFLDSLNLPNLEDRASAQLSSVLHNYTGGNPLFILETLKYLIETAQLNQSLPEQLPPPGRVGTLIRQRLERLSQPALRVAQTAAVLQSDFDIELVAKTLESRPLELVTPWEELEAASILQSNRFSHDLIRVAVHAGISHPVRQLLHQRAAEALESSRTNPAKIAMHWLESREPQRAIPWLFKAAERAESAFLLHEALSFYKQALHVAEERGTSEEVFEALSMKAQYLALERVPSDEPTEQVLDTLSARAITPVQRARASHLEAVFHYRRGRGIASIEAAQRGLAELRQASDAKLEAELRFSLGIAHWLQNQFKEAQTCFEQMIQGARALGNERQAAYGLTLLGQTMSWLAQDRQALEHFRRAAEVFERIGDKFRLAHTLTNTAMSLGNLGQYGTAEQLYLRADQVLGKATITTGHQAHNIAGLANLYIGLERYSEALEWLKQKEDLAAIAVPFQGVVARTWALLYLALGQHQRFDTMITTAIERRHRTDPLRSLAKIIYAAELARRDQHDEARALFQRAERALSPETGAPPILLIYLWFARAFSVAPEDGLRDIEQAKALIAERELSLFNAEAELRHAQILLALNHPVEALAYMGLAHQRHAEIPYFGQYAELPFTHYRILQALEHEDASAQLEKAHAHVLTIAEHHVPEGYRQSFLAENPLNAAIARAWSSE